MADDIVDAFDDADVTNDEALEEEVVTEEETIEETPQQDAKRKYKLKQGDVFEDVELSDYEVAMAVQKARHADKRFQEAGLKEQQASALFQLFKSNPYEALKAMGHDPEELAEQLVYTKAKRSLLTPEQQKMYDMEAELEQLRSEKTKSAEQEKLREVQQLETSIVAEIDKTLDEAKLPKSRELRKQVAYYMLEADRLGYQVSPKDVLEFAVKDYKERLHELFGGMEAEQLLDFFGSPISDKIRKFDISKAKKQLTNPVHKTSSAPKPVVKTKASKIYDTNEFCQSL